VITDRDRLRHVEHRLAFVGADVCFTDDEIDAMLDGEATKWCQIETDRLALLVKLQTEMHTRRR
jgi:hypothetical protein